MSGPTPGPWRIGPINYADVYACKDGELIALIVKERPGTVADALLIAAAPDLYVALEKAHHELNTIHARDGVPWTGVPQPMPTDVTQEYFTSVVEECRAALRKARGETA